VVACQHRLPTKAHADSGRLKVNRQLLLVARKVPLLCSGKICPMHVLEIRNAPVHFQGIADAAMECLLKSPYHDVRCLSCEYGHSILFLRGRLPNFYQKQLAQEAVARVKGVTQVVNEIEVD
jgi:hypothetical protein